MLTLFLFSDVMDDLYKWVNPKTKKHSPMISKEIHEIILRNADVSLEHENSAVLLLVFVKFDLHIFLFSLH